MEFSNLSETRADGLSQSQVRLRQEQEQGQQQRRQQYPLASARYPQLFRQEEQRKHGRRERRTDIERGRLVLVLR